MRRIWAVNLWLDSSSMAVVPAPGNIAADISNRIDDQSIPNWPYTQWRTARKQFLSRYDIEAFRLRLFTQNIIDERGKVWKPKSDKFAVCQHRTCAREWKLRNPCSFLLLILHRCLFKNTVREYVIEDRHADTHHFWKFERPCKTEVSIFTSASRALKAFIRFRSVGCDGYY